MTKAELRKEYKQARLALTDAQYCLQNERILGRLMQQDWTSVRYLHVYLPMQNMREVDTWPFIKWIQQFHPDIVLVVSRSNFSDSSMSHFEFSSTKQLEENKWGILEPLDSLPTVPVHSIDVVIVPLLVSDQQGNRVGYGKGFYDRFLSSCRPDCLKIGLSLFPTVSVISDLNPYDIPLDKLITADSIYTFSS